MVTLVLVIYLLSLSVIFLYAVMQFSLAVNYLRNHRKKRKQLVSDLTYFPFVTVQLPLYNEKYVVERLLEKILQFDWPADRWEIQILDDSTDETTAIIEKFLQSVNSGVLIRHIRRAERLGYKAGALAEGLKTANGEFIAIFDADFLPEPDFLRRTVPLFNDPEVGLVQTRWEHINREYSLLTKLQAFALDAHFSIEQSARNFKGYFINFNGTGGVWRRSTIETSGGWQSDTLTEDLDLSYRSQLSNWKFIYREDIAAPAELPVAMSGLRSQQFRWTKGGAETFRKIAPGLVRSKGIRFAQKVHGLAHLFNSTVFVFVLLLALSSVGILWFASRGLLTVKWLDYTLLFFISTAFLLFYYAVSFREKMRWNWLKPFVFILRFFEFLVVTMGLSYSNSLAVLQGYFGRKTPFIRTPKFNIESGSKNDWKTSNYLINKSFIKFVPELLLAAFFCIALIIGIYSEIYGMLFFHAMVALGFFLVFVFSIVEQVRD